MVRLHKIDTKSESYNRVRHIRNRSQTNMDRSEWHGRYSGAQRLDLRPEIKNQLGLDLTRDEVTRDTAEFATQIFRSCSS